MWRFWLVWFKVMPTEAVLGSFPYEPCLWRCRGGFWLCGLHGQENTWFEIAISFFIISNYYRSGFGGSNTRFWHVGVLWKSDRKMWSFYIHLWTKTNQVLSLCYLARVEGRLTRDKWCWPYGVGSAKNLAVAFYCLARHLAAAESIGPSHKPFNGTVPWWLWKCMWREEKLRKLTGHLPTKYQKTAPDWTFRRKFQCRNYMIFRKHHRSFLKFLSLSKNLRNLPKASFITTYGSGP